MTRICLQRMMHGLRSGSGDPAQLFPSHPGAARAAAATPAQAPSDAPRRPVPVKATGTDAEKALVFAQTYAALRRRIMTFVELPFESLSRMSLQSRVDAIGTDTKAKA